MKEYPKWLYHKEKEAVVVNNLEEHEALGSEWAETPAAFLQNNEENLQQEEESLDKAQTEEAESSEPPVLQTRDFTKMKVAELKAFLVEQGFAQEEVESLKKDELIAKIGEL